MLVRKVSRVASLFANKLVGHAKGLNSKAYWNFRFRHNWESFEGRLQTAIFAAGFVLLDEHFEAASILDFGCGTGDSLPLLRMRFPKASLHYYDFSKAASTIAEKNYSHIATAIEPATDPRRFELVYCSNVLEHIQDPCIFAREVCALSSKYVVFQAPHDERHADGSPLSTKCPRGEHVNTITQQTMGLLEPSFIWKYRTMLVPYAWPHGEQIFFIGLRQHRGFEMMAAA
jgi:SAM-dependent methyltransferase